MLIITFYVKEQELTHPTIVNYRNAIQLSKEFVSILRCKKKKRTLNLSKNYFRMERKNFL